MAIKRDAQAEGARRGRHRHASRAPRSEGPHHTGATGGGADKWGEYRAGSADNRTIVVNLARLPPREGPLIPRVRRERTARMDAGLFPWWWTVNLWVSDRGSPIHWPVEEIP